jgi:NAD(P)H-dependent FMN reductase
MPEYNFGYNAPLKNAIDYLHAEWLYKPVGFASYGGVSGGTRAVQMIKQEVTALKMVAVYEAVSIPFVRQFVAPDGTIAPNDVMVSAAKDTLDELCRMCASLRPLRHTQ